MNVFVNLTTGIVYLEFVALMGFLVFLCFRTRSKGLILVAAALAVIKVRFLSWIVGTVLYAYMGQGDPGLDVRGVKLLRRLDIAIITYGIEDVLCYSLSLLGVFLIYKEWQQGKFRNLQPEHVEGPKV